MTSEEATLWAALRRNALAGLHFRRQQLIDGFIVDFYCHRAALVVEVDGSSHNHTHAYDAERDKVLRARGLNVLRLPATDVRANLDDCLHRIATAAQRQHKHP
jgi:very-short-patch-repair endonuclease